MPYQNEAAGWGIFDGGSYNVHRADPRHTTSRRSPGTKMHDVASSPHASAVRCTLRQRCGS